MSLAFFDMDGTLINGDTNEITFSRYLESGLVDNSIIEKLEKLEASFYLGTLDIKEYYRFAVMPLKDMTVKQIDEYISDVVQSEILKRVYPGALKAIEFHKKRGDTTVIVTSSTDYIAKPVASALGIDLVISGEIIIENDHLTDKVKGLIPFQENKVKRIYELVERLNLSLEDSYGYGDTINDLPMLSICTHRYAVNPNQKLLQHPKISSLEIVSWS